LGEARFGLWFGEGVRLGIAGDALEVGVPNAFFREWIEGHFAETLIAAGAEGAGRGLRLAVRIDDEAEPQVGHEIDPPAPGQRRRTTVKVPLDPHAPASPRLPAPGPPPERPRNLLRRQRSLDDFVTGACNRLAYAASLEMVQSIGATFNPLLIHG